jgi:hypothetical protein
VIINLIHRLMVRIKILYVLIGDLAFVYFNVKLITMRFVCKMVE